MTSTSREALVVFAENVENVNKAVDNMNSSLPDIMILLMLILN